VNWLSWSGTTGRSLQHLAKLRLARLVRTRREGNRIYYVVDDVHVRRLVEEVVSHAGHDRAEGA